MSRARFPVVGLLDNASKVQRGTFTIDRATGIVAVRAHRRRRIYRLPLSAVADWIVQSILKAEDRERRAARRLVDHVPKAKRRKR